MAAMTAAKSSAFVRGSKPMVQTPKIAARRVTFR